MRNIPDARHEPLNVRATIVACVHGNMEDGGSYATLLAIKFQFPQNRPRRARLADINLLFTTKGASLEVIDFAPREIQFYGSPGTRTLPPNNDIGLSRLHEGTVSPEIPTQSTGTVRGHSRPNIQVKHGSGRHNTAMWSIRENESARSGIPESLLGVVLLERKDQEPFSMMPHLRVEVSGSAFARALAGKLPENSSVMFNPKMAFPVKDSDSEFSLAGIDVGNLKDFWYSQILNLEDDAFVPRTALSSLSDLSSNDRDPAIAGALDEPVTESTDIRELKHYASSGEFQQDFREAMEKASYKYAELWNRNAESSNKVTLRWKELKDTVDDTVLKEHFSWLKDEMKLQHFSSMKDELQDRRTKETEASEPRQKASPVEVPHTLCSLLAHKAKGDENSDKSLQLLKEETINTITEFFELDKEDYNSWRQLDFGSCEFNSEGDGPELKTMYMIQTPYYSSGFWSMFLVGKADPRDPDRARKLSGVIQTGVDVKLDKILTDTALKAGALDHHPLVLPCFLYVNHFESTTDTFNSVLNKVQTAEADINKALGDANDRGLDNIRMSLHQASMEFAELTRRRGFEIRLMAALKDEAKIIGSTEGQMLRELNRYERRADAHQLELGEMPARIDSLKNLLYFMIAQQDNVVSHKMATEGLSDSKAMKTLSIMTILFLPGTFVATLFTTEMISFQGSAAETMAYIIIAIPLTAVLMIIYLAWKPLRARVGMGDLETGSKNMFHKSSNASGKADKQS